MSDKKEEKVIPTKVVHIHRQTTADDARLLSELEKEAMDKVKNLIVHNVKGLDMEFITYEYSQHPSSSTFMMNHNTYVAFILNGEEHHVVVTEEINALDDKEKKDPSVWIKLFYNELSKVLAEKLITENDMVRERVLQNKYKQFQ